MTTQPPAEAEVLEQYDLEDRLHIKNLKSKVRILQMPQLLEPMALCAVASFPILKEVRPTLTSFKLCSHIFTITVAAVGERGP